MSIEFNSVRLLARDFGRIPLELRAELKPHLLAAATIVANQAKANASFSTRIPAAIGVQALFGAKTGGAVVKVDRRKAPHGRALEGITKGGRNRSSFRHPVYGNRDVWVEQPTHPYLAPAAAETRDQVKAQVADAVKAATRHLNRSYG